MAFFTPAVAAATAAGVGAVGSIISGVGQYSAAKSQAQADRQNARLAVEQGQSEAALIRERARRLSGQSRAAIGASGVDISGSFLDALEDSDINAELDAQTALWNRKLEASNYRARARQARASGPGALLGGILGAGSQALQGYGSASLLSAQGGGKTPASPSASSGYSIGTVNPITGMYGHI
jgi:hypothetical protein